MTIPLVLIAAIARYWAGTSLLILIVFAGLTFAYSTAFTSISLAASSITSARKALGLALFVYVTSLIIWPMATPVITGFVEGLGETGTIQGVLSVLVPTGAYWALVQASLPGIGGSHVVTYATAAVSSIAWIAVPTICGLWRFSQMDV